MPKLIKNNAVIDNPWQLIGKDTDVSTALSSGSELLLVPLALWLENKNDLQASGKQIGVWLDSDETPESLLEDISKFELIALNFPAFTDGRSYSSAAILRQRLGFQGELRAIGDVLRDQLFYMKKCGFDSFDVSDDVKTEDALSAFADFSNNYQSTVEEPQPLFRRR